MRILAHTVPNEGSFLDRLLHPFTGVDHLVAMALVASSGVLLFLALRGRDAATTSGSTTRIRTLGFTAAAGLAFAASIVVLVLT